VRREVGRFGSGCSLVLLGWFCGVRYVIASGEARDEEGR
jgi:hypothetical protein